MMVSVHRLRILSEQGLFQRRDLDLDLPEHPSSAATYVTCYSYHWAGGSLSIGE